jgi:catalase
VLAQVDPYLCEQAALGLGLPVPQAPAPLAEMEPSPALSQVGQTGPVKGRIISIVAGEDSNLLRRRAKSRGLTRPRAGSRAALTNGTRRQSK